MLFPIVRHTWLLQSLLLNFVLFASVPALAQPKLDDSTINSISGADGSKLRLQELKFLDTHTILKVTTPTGSDVVGGNQSDCFTFKASGQSMTAKPIKVRPVQRLVETADGKILLVEGISSCKQ